MAKQNDSNDDGNDDCIDDDNDNYNIGDNNHLLIISYVMSFYELWCRIWLEHLWTFTTSPSHVRALWKKKQHHLDNTSTHSSVN